MVVTGNVLSDELHCMYNKFDLVLSNNPQQTDIRAARAPHL